MNSSKNVNSNERWVEQLITIATEIAERAGCILYDLELVGTGSGRTLRVFIDKDTTDGTGVGVEDCTNVSRGLNEKLDTEDLVPGEAYNLEVSSPGLDRQLRKKWHFQKVVGKKIYVKLSQNLGSLGVQEKSLESMKQFDAVLVAFNEEADELEFEYRTFKFKVPFAKIEKSKVVFEMNTASTKKKK